MTPRRTSRRTSTGSGWRCSTATPCCRASSSRTAGSTSRPSRRSSACRCPAASAATSAARSTSTARATCTSRRATTRTRSSRRATRRSTIGRPAIRRSTPGARRATRTTSAASSCASASATNGGYTVPAGNLFRQGQALTRPEIYAMGFRNPFRFAVNRTNGDVYVGDYSPDAQTPDPARGPEGIGRWMIVRRPVNFGWPFCITPDKPYVDYDFTPDADAVRRGVQLQRADQRLAQQHRPAQAAGGRPAGRLVLVHHGPGPVPGAVQPRGARIAATASGRWAVRRCSSTGSIELAVPLAARVLRATRSSTSGRGTTRRSSS